MLRCIINTFRWLIGERPPTSPWSPSTPPAQRQQNSRRSGPSNYDNQYRQKAIEEDRLMKECFKKGFVEEANRHKAKKEAENKKAVKFILSNNPNNTQNRVDLHELYVDEALEVVKERLSKAKALGCRKYHIITGRGSHSKDHQPKIKPKIIEYLRNMKYRFKEDERNPGSLTVFLELDQ